MTRRPFHRRHAVLRRVPAKGVIWLVLTWLSLSGHARAQSLWEVTPYQVLVWVAVETHPRMDPSWQQQLVGDIERLAENRVGAVWRLTAEGAPSEYASNVLGQNELDLAQLKLPSATHQPDKLVLVSLQADPTGYRLSVREADLTVRRWSATQSCTLPSTENLGTRTLSLICQVFAPLVRIERIDGPQVQAVARAGALMRPAESARHWLIPTQFQAGDVLQPVLVRTDRNGQVGPEGVQPIEWTVMTVTQLVANQIECTYESGYRQPFSTRRSARVQQLAIRLRPQFDATVVRLVDRRATAEPLVGYEVDSRPPGEENQSIWSGPTDWRGEVTIPRDSQQVIQVLYVRSGQQMLAKLPLVPGDRPLLIAPLRNDDLRLEAEGFLIGVQDSLVDLVARREVLSVRIRRAIESGKLDEAEQLLRELRQLETQDDFLRRVQQRKQSLSTVDVQVQQKIDELFAQTAGLLGKYLSQEQVDQLTQQLQAARQQGGANAAPP